MRRAAALALGLTLGAAGAEDAAGRIEGRRHARLIIRNAMVVEGVGTPAAGPRDIVIEGNRITRVGTVGATDGQGVELDARGKWVLPGLINIHGHVHDERGGAPLEVSYPLKLWLAAGITTVRDVGSHFEGSKRLREQSAAGEIAAPRLYLYPIAGGVRTREEAVERVRALKAGGADGIKHLGTYRDVMEGLRAEARAQGLRTAHHCGVEETNAWDDIRLGTTSIEHWYGIPDAALEGGVQRFPASYNYMNETDRFRWAGRLWREADWGRLEKVLQGMVDAQVAWNPTLVIYEASRDLQRAQNQPWFRDYLHPVLERFFVPDARNHGSYFFGWTTEDEVYWRENYRIWMKALKEFARRGGVIGAGEDAGYIYQMYGFALIRELELHQEAGFHPLEVIRHATHNGARILGREHEIGRVRAGWLADLIIVNGNPLENFKLLYPAGVTEYRDGKPVKVGGVEWTIKDGIPYHAPTLLREVGQMVEKAGSGRR